MVGKDRGHSIHRTGFQVASRVSLALSALAAVLVVIFLTHSPVPTTTAVAADKADPSTIAGRTDRMSVAPHHDAPAPSSVQTASDAGRPSVIRASARSGSGPQQRGANGVSFDDLCAAGLDETGVRCPTAGGAPGRGTDKGDTAADESPRLAISGRVMTEDGLGVDGISVIASPTRLYRDEDAAGVTGPARRYEAVTDSSGHYAFGGLPDGEYRVRAAAPEPYRSAWTTVRAGVAYADLVLVTEETVVVHGRVTDDGGDPLEGVVVLPVVLGVASATTDRDGRYRLPVTVEPAARGFMVRFQLPGFNEEYVSTGPADRVDAEGTVLDVVMRPVGQWTTVEGTVASTDGTPLAGRSVQLRPTGQQRMLRAVTDGSGRFVFPAVEADMDYRLDVSGAPDFDDYSRRVRITIDDSRFDVDLKPFAYGDVTGRMVNLDGSPIPNFHLAVRHAGSMASTALVTSDREGNFEVTDAPAGELIFATQSTPSILVRGIRLEAGDALDVPLVLDWGEHEIRGLVVDHRGNPVPASRVVLKWAHQQDGISSMATRRTAADAQGNFLFSQLGPGPHRLEIDAPGHPAVRLEHDAARQGYDLLVRLN